MDGTRAELQVQTHSNGSFQTTRYSKITGEGMESFGVLRGRWNVYYSQPQDRDRFWMQVLVLMQELYEARHNLARIQQVLECESMSSLEAYPALLMNGYRWSRPYIQRDVRSPSHTDVALHSLKPALYSCGNVISWAALHYCAAVRSNADVSWAVTWLFFVQILRLKSTGVNMWSDLLLLGDLRPVHTWRDLESQLYKWVFQSVAVNTCNLTCWRRGIRCSPCVLLCWTKSTKVDSMCPDLLNERQRRIFFLKDISCGTSEVAMIIDKLMRRGKLRIGSLRISRVSSISSRCINYCFCHYSCSHQLRWPPSPQSILLPWHCFHHLFPHQADRGDAKEWAIQCNRVSLSQMNYAVVWQLRLQLGLALYLWLCMLCVHTSIWRMCAYCLHRRCAYLFSRYLFDPSAMLSFIWLVFACSDMRVRYRMNSTRNVQTGTMKDLGQPDEDEVQLEDRGVFTRERQQDPEGMGFVRRRYEISGQLWPSWWFRRVQDAGEVLD